MRSRTTLIVLALLAAAAPVRAQSGKKVLTQADYDIWRTLQGAALSHDGTWATYTIQPLVGEGELVVRNTRSGVEYRHTRGYTGRPPAPGMPAGRGAGASEEGEEVVQGPGARFTADSKYLLFMVDPTKEEVERGQATRARAGRGGRGGAAGAPERNSLGIINLSDGKTTLLPGVRSFQLAEKSGRFVAYLLQADSAAQPQGQRAADVDSSSRPKNRKSFGSTMVLRELATGTETRVEDVLLTAFNEDGTVLAYTVSSRAQPANDGVFLRSLADGKVTAAATGVGNYRLLTFDRTGQQIAFVSDRDEYVAQPRPRFALYHAPLRSPAKAIVPSTALREAGSVADRGQVTFSRDGSAVQFAIAPALPDSVPADSLASKAIYDLWHYRDPRLQSQQQLSLSRDRQRTFSGIHHIAAGKFVQLTDDAFPNNPTLSDNAKIAVQNTGVPYLVEAMWGEGGTDIYLLNPLTGARKLLKQRARLNGTLSPAAKYVTWFAEGKWYAYSVAAGRTRDLTGGLGVKFDQETHDTPSIPPAWGIAGWTPNDASVLVYDRYDIWELDPDGVKPARVVTDSVGRRARTVFRVVELDSEERFLDPSKPLLLRAVDDQTKASGFYHDRIAGSQRPAKIVMNDRNMGPPQKAHDAEQYLLTQSTFTESPDLWIGPSLDRLTKISDANPQQKDYRWGNVEIVSWLNLDGVPVRGLLYKPEDFDPSKKYPMVVYFYEQHTNTLHNYAAPSGRNVINVPVYVSRGYLVFEPDIYYTEGYPGPSAVKTIVPGVQMLINRGYVKEDGIGIQGQSWGGYQTAYVVTQSNLFRAAMAGAPVANMTSAYGGIRWESGNSRTSQYEHGQSRIGGSPWEFPERFIENSPLFYADRIKTPLLIMHNDQDGAVPWQQGIEMFIAMRRLGKEAYLINYNGDAHNPRKRANQRDMDVKMQQFFDHHLTGAPMPDWMKNGIPMLQKGRDQIAVPAKPVSTTSTSTRNEQTER